MLKDKDFSPTGLKLEGKYENDRNADSSKLFRDILAEVYGATQSIIAHHLTYVTEDMQDGFAIQTVQEIPGADTLIFDHDIAKKLWGDAWKDVLISLALEPVATRDALLDRLYYSRTTGGLWANR